MSGASALIALALLRFIPPTAEEMQADADKILLECKADQLIAVAVKTSQRFEIKPLKTPAERTSADAEALKCVGDSYTNNIDFRPVAETLLTLKVSDAQTH
jgi:hypothetical protein